MELPANLDDGELWIPSDIFPTDDALHHNRPTSDVFLEDLSRQLSKINFQSVIPQRLGISGNVTQFGAVTIPSPNASYGQTPGPNRVDRRLFNSISGPVHQSLGVPGLPFPVHEPVAEHLMETRNSRSRPVHFQQQNQLSPFQANACRFGYGPGLIRHSSRSSTSSGTGVFIPQATHNSAINSGSGKNRTGVPRTGVMPQRRPAKKLALRKLEDCYHPLPSPEIGLPEEWSY
ncbi:uncharacterized protein LOC130813667 [Amaranthus tricolor]|uniref:uncharacterized protein LOC130813667 n=1 Tax=Amaranthus tricolor TaxID=29722 RepID=UPI0025892780|nr:uncharacterized protein LOC130813667 [Amaranthus tricolor]